MWDRVILLLDLMGEYTLKAWSRILSSGSSLLMDAQKLDQYLAAKGKWKHTVDSYCNNKCDRFIWIPEASEVQLSGLDHIHDLTAK